MKEEKCVECKVICIECKNYRKDNTCGIFQIKKMNCINGTGSCDYDLCINHNEKGNCKSFVGDEVRIATQKLIYALREYHRIVYSYNTLGANVKNLLSGLEGNHMNELCYYSVKERIEKYKCKKYEN